MRNINGWNTKAAELTGLSLEDAIGLPLIDLVNDDSVDVAKTVLSFALQGDDVLSYIYSMKVSIFIVPIYFLHFLTI